MRPLASLLLALTVGAAGGASAAGAEPGQVAAWRAWFVTGGSMDVLVAEPADASDPLARLTRLELVGGGEIVVPSDRLLRLEELTPPLPSDALAAASSDRVAAPDDPRVRRWDDLVERSAARHGLDPDLVRAVIAVESAGDPRAVSVDGAVGLMQLLPTTAADYGITELMDPARNIEAGCRHLARLHDVLEGNLELVVAAYNAGEGAVARFGGVPHYTETRRYVRSVLAKLALAGRPSTRG